MIYNGYEIVVDINKIVYVRTDKILRTLKERLFSLPWKPFKKFTYTPIYEPDTTITIFRNKMVMHPIIAERLKNENST